MQVEVGGALVPMIVNWPGKTPAGKVCADAVDSTDFYATFAELAGATFPAITVDGRNMAAQFRGERGRSHDSLPGAISARRAE